MSDFFIIDENKKVENNTNIFSKSLKSDKTFMERINNFLLSMQKIKTKEKVIFYRLLSTMTNAWMSLVKSMWVLESQEKNPVLKKILWNFCKNLKTWKNLSECMESYDSSFWEAEVWIIKSWEKTGWLNHVLKDLADQIEKVESISWKIKWAMVYPGFILLIVLWVIWVMMTLVVPKLLDIFGDKTNLPVSTKILMSISDIFVNYWFFAVFFVLVFGVFLHMWKKTPDWKYVFENFLLNIPVFGGINRKLVLSKFSRVFSWLLSSWVSVVESLNITAESVWNEVYKQRILLLSSDVQRWIKIWESLDWDHLFPEMMIQMIQVWEQTAKLDLTIIKVAEFYDEEVDNTIRILNKLLEPFIIVFLAVVVWFIAFAIMQPIMNLADTISK